VQIPPDAIIPDGKITRYLLVPKASGDKSKYLARGGFNQTNPAALETEIRRLTAETNAIVERASSRGVYYNVLGTLVGPSGAKLPVKLVWLRRLDGVFTLVTLIPQAGS
jgi:hypothetical protein